MNNSRMPDGPQILDDGAPLEGGYRVVRRIGTGGMGEVYLLSHLQNPGLRRALKVMRPNQGVDLEFEKRFKLEFEAMRRVRHPGIVAVHQLMRFRYRGRPLIGIVMDYIDGENLEKRISRDGAMPVGEALPLFYEVLEALDAVHQTVQVVVRDL